MTPASKLISSLFQNNGNVTLIRKSKTRRVFMRDFAGKERRRTPRPYNDKEFNRVLEIALVVCAGGVLALMFWYMPA